MPWSPRKWHVGDAVTINVIDQRTGKSIQDFFAFILDNKPNEVPKSGWSSGHVALGGFMSKGKKIADNVYSFTPGFSYALSKEDVQRGNINVQIFAQGYEEGIASISAGAKSGSVYLNPDPKKENSSESAK